MIGIEIVCVDWPGENVSVPLFGRVVRAGERALGAAPVGGRVVDRHRESHAAGVRVTTTGIEPCFSGADASAIESTEAVEPTGSTVTVAVGAPRKPALESGEVNAIVNVPCAVRAWLEFTWTENVCGP